MPSYKCSECDEVFTKWTRCLSHLKNIHFIESKKIARRIFNGAQTINDRQKRNFSVAGADLSGRITHDSNTSVSANQLIDAEYPELDDNINSHDIDNNDDMSDISDVDSLDDMSEITDVTFAAASIR
jgi:hypothetical protein